ncbi:hypothetical protein FH972_010052 [Carpinus fangiana]|uniref:Fatty acyl-CoA reductase n=1 Tax=Carpinus fangiana TaxID=176857 RepID=A0A660KQ86_9ROSI|nr:hypothetical protein FH972_010052 [Carpinus fangiana]
MELESMPKFLEKKTILVTGATGFLAKAFLEKILRVQPDVRRLYLLIRASDLASATQRLHNEVIGKDLFRIVQEKWCANLDSFISEKVIAVPSNVYYENLGVKDCQLRKDMWTELDIILNSAATTRFDERTIDGVISAYGKGKLKCFLGHHETIFDIIPADMVVNCMIVAMVAYANQPYEIILHVGSSWRNPIKFSRFRNVIVRYFAENPLFSNNGKSIRVENVTVLSSMASFRAYMAIRYLMPLKVFQIANAVICQYYQDSIIDHKRKIKSVIRLAELYKPFVFFMGRFDDSNTEKLQMATSESGVDSHLFGFDPKCIDWEDYLMNTHIPGLIKYALKI